MRCPKCGKAHTRVVDSRMRSQITPLSVAANVARVTIALQRSNDAKTQSRSLSRTEPSSGSIAISCSSA